MGKAKTPKIPKIPIIPKAYTGIVPSLSSKERAKIIPSKPIIQPIVELSAPVFPSKIPPPPRTDGVGTIPLEGDDNSFIINIPRDTTRYQAGVPVNPYAISPTTRYQGLSSFYDKLKAIGGSATKMPSQMYKAYQGISPEIKQKVIIPLALAGIAGAYAKKQPDVSSGIVGGMKHYYDTKAVSEKQAKEDALKESLLAKEYGYKLEAETKKATADLKKEQILAKDKEKELFYKKIKDMADNGTIYPSEYLKAYGVSGEDIDALREIAEYNKKLQKKELSKPYPGLNIDNWDRQQEKERLISEGRKIDTFLKEYPSNESKKEALETMTPSEREEINKIFEKRYGTPLYEHKEVVTPASALAKITSKYLGFGKPETRDWEIQVIDNKPIIEDLKPIPKKLPVNKSPKVKISGKSKQKLSPEEQAVSNQWQ